MLSGHNLTYIRHERKSGISQKSNQPYDFASITLSDGMESFKLDLKPDYCDNPIFLNLNRGDKVDVVIDVYEDFNRLSFIVVNVAVSAKSATSKAV